MNKEINMDIELLKHLANTLNELITKVEDSTSLKLASDEDLVKELSSRYIDKNLMRDILDNVIDGHLLDEYYFDNRDDVVNIDDVDERWIIDNWSSSGVRDFVIDYLKDNL